LTERRRYSGQEWAFYPTCSAPWPGPSLHAGERWRALEEEEEEEAGGVEVGEGEKGEGITFVALPGQRLLSTTPT
jgi:hypothetical protein